jgi:hypothetical protein
MRGEARRQEEQPYRAQTSVNLQADHSISDSTNIQIECNRFETATIA